jgi:xylose isomerase
VEFAQKLKMYKKMGFDGVQFHDDDAVASVEVPHAQMIKEAQETKKALDGEGLAAEFVAPRLWEHPLTVDGGYTANDPKARQYALERSRKAIDIARVLGTRDIVLWPAREGIYVNESKDHRLAAERFVQAVNSMLEYDRTIRILGEMKPNEPMDHAYLPTTGHFLSISYLTVDPARVGVLIETAHALLAGLDPAGEMAFALYHKKLWGVHLNDQNGLKFDEDKSFGAVDLRRAFNQVRVLDAHRFYETGVVGMDVKAMRTQPAALATRHLQNSLHTFLRLVEVVRGLDQTAIDQAIAVRDYEALDWIILSALMGK